MVRIIEATPGEDYTLFVKLNNGKCGVFDVRPFLDKGIFAELKNKEYFNLVQVRGRSISWPHNQDFCADTLDELVEEQK